jgi:Putative auto-transporter adhesin, head GIN domain
MKKLAWLIVLVPILVTGCHHGMRAEIRGSGKRQMEKRTIPSFTSISTEGAFTIEVTCQKEPSLEVEGDDNVLAFVKAEVGGNVLRLTNSKSYSVNEPVKFKISVPNLEGLSVSGAGKIEIKGMNNEKFEIDSSGAPSINVSGSTKVIDIDASGAGKIDTRNLHASRAVVDSKGVCKVDVDVAEQLDVTVSGPSSVTYKGNPVVNKTINGPGKVERRGGEGA